MTGQFRGVELRSKVTAAGRVELTLADAVLLNPEQDELIVQVEAVPLNPSDIALLLRARR